MTPTATKKTYTLPSYEQCVDICKRAGETVFYEKTYTVDGYKVSTFNYMLAQYADFVSFQGYELRGLTFVFNLDGTLYKRFPLLRKFFNLNQVEETQLHVVKDLPFNSVYRKEDGSVISFFDLPNGRILSKSKMESDNVQAKMSFGVYESDRNVQCLVQYCLANDITPIFELVSPKNRIVLKYVTTELILLRLRDNISGAYIEASEMPAEVMGGIKMPEDFSSVYTNWTDLVEHVLTTTEEIEGYVVDCGDLMKIKTLWYCERHRLVTGDAWREDFIITQTLEGTIDDVLAQLDEGDVELREHIENIETVTVNYLKDTVANIRAFVDAEYKGDKGVFARTFGKHLYFHYAMALINGKDIVKHVTDYVIKNTNRLEEARTFIDTGKVNGTV